MSCFLWGKSQTQISIDEFILLFYVFYHNILFSLLNSISLSNNTQITVRIRQILFSRFCFLFLGWWNYQSHSSIHSSSLLTHMHTSLSGQSYLIYLNCTFSVSIKKPISFLDTISKVLVSFVPKRQSGFCNFLPEGQSLVITILILNTIHNSLNPIKLTLQHSRPE